MDFDTKTEKQADGTTVVSHKLTGMPIAIVRPDGYKKNGVKVEWHPDFKLLHPEIDSNLLTRNYSSLSSKYDRNSHDSLSSAVSSSGNKAKNIINGNYEKDPVKTEYEGESPNVTPGEENYKHKYRLFDDEGERIGSIRSVHAPHEIHPDSPARLKLLKGYVEENGISKDTLESSQKKHPGSSLQNVMNRARYVLDNKHKEPRFIGTTKAKEAESNNYKTKLEPEEASKAYEDVLRKKLGDKFEFTRHSPTAFMAHKPADSIYGSSETHHVISLPGELQHIKSHTDHPNYEYATKNTNVVESKQ